MNSVQVSDGSRVRPRLRGHRAIAAATLTLVLLNLLWRTVRYGMAFPIWGDEAFVIINILRRSFLELLQPLEYALVVPLGFSWPEWIVTRLFGFSELALHLFPFVTGIVSMLLFWFFARCVLDRRSAMLAIGIFAASYYPVRHATEVKPYAGDLLVGLVLIILGWRVCERPASLGRWIALIMAAAVGIWISYPSVFVVGGIGLALLYTLVRSPSPRMIAFATAYGVAVSVSFLAMFLVMAQPQAESGWSPSSPGTVEQWGAGFPPMREFWRLPLWVLDIHTGNMFAYPVGGKHGGSTVTFVLVLIGSVAIWRQGRRDLLLLLLGSLPFAFIAAALHRYPYGTSARLAQFVASSICLLAGLGLMTSLKFLIPRRIIPKAIAVIVFLLAGITLAGTAVDIVHPYKTFGDYENRRILRELRDETRTGDQWVSFNVADPQTPYGDDFYLRGGHGAMHRLYLNLLAPVPIAWAPPPQTLQASPGTRIFLVIYRDDRLPFPEQRLKTYVAEMTRTLGTPQVRSYEFGEGRFLEIDVFGAT